MKNPIKNALYSLLYDRGHLMYAILVRLSFLFPNDELYLRLIYRCQYGRPLNLKKPQLFSEKIQWLKLYNHQPIYTTMVDKWAVKDYVASIIGSEYVIPTLGVWNRVEDVEWDKLPNQFVLKTNHDGGANGIVICKDKTILNKRKAIQELKRSFNRSSYLIGREWPYKMVTHKVFAEQYMEDNSGELRDYKFFCFNGKVRCYKVDFNRMINHRANYYDCNGDILPYGEAAYLPKYDEKLQMPANISQMIELAEKLSAGQPFMRVDFYNVEGKIYFGEITFFPAGGMSRWVGDVDVDVLWGSWLTLPNEIKI